MSTVRGKLVEGTRMFQEAASAYRLIATLAIRRGFDPDHPAYLRKVTETV
jgi:fructoselysine-6-P-deglycase FrlB-like protein